MPSYPGLTVVGATPDAPQIAADADLVVSQAGYNGIAELRAMRKPAVLVPGHRRAEDQAARARRLVACGAAVLPRPTSRSIAKRIVALLGGERATLASMAAAHDRRPIVAGNAAAARAALGVLPEFAVAAPPVRRVVLVAHDFPPRIGGMETVAREIATTLARRGVEVIVYTTARVGSSDVPGVRVRRLFTPLRDPQNIDLLRDLLLTIDAAARDRPDVVHLCHAGLAPWIPALRATLPVRATVNVHGNDLLAPWVESGATRETYRDAIRAGLAAADAVLPVSAFSAARAAEFGADAARLRVVPNGVDVAAFPPRGPRDAARRERVIVTVARLASRKGHGVVLHALRELPGVRYVFTGTHERLLAGILDLARTLGVAGRVEAAGFLAPADLAALLARADVFVLVPEDRDPADVEGFGVALLEAAAAGLPVVASRTGGIPEAVEDGVTGLLVPPGDHVATAAAVRRLLDDEALAASMGRAGRDRAAVRFSWDATAARLLDAWAAPPTPRPAGISDLTALASGEPGTDEPSVLGLRDAIAKLRHPSELALLARLEAREERAVAAKRREGWTRTASSGRRVRLRATGEGERILASVLDDTTAAGVVPDVELRLRRFADARYRSALLPRVYEVHLHHRVPSPDAAAILRDVARISDDDLRRVASLRIHLAADVRPDARRAADCVPEVHALRAALAARGISVLPPPELMRYLSLTPGGPPTGMIEPTNHCNLRCPTCPTGTGKIAPTPDLTPERFATALSGLVPTLRNLALWNYGEPTLNRHLPQLISHAKERGVGVVKVSSNVHFLNGERGAALLASGLDVLILSVDGASQETYSRFRVNGDFAKVAEAVRGLCAEKARLGLAKPRIELQFIVMKHNEHEVDRMRALAAEWGVDRLRIKTFGAEDDANRDLVPETAAFSRYDADRATPNRAHPFCTMPWDHTVVNADGSVNPCCYLRSDMGEQYVMGNVFETPFAEIWRGPKYRAFRAAMLRDRREMPVCGTCRGGTHDLLAAVEEVAR